MQLKLTRSQRDGGVVSAKVIFCLDARIQLTSGEQSSVNRYKLGNQVIYNSEASKRHLAATDDALKDGTFGGTVRALGRLALVALNLNITINSLQRGQHIECKSLDELLAAEDAIMEACKNLRTYLDTAATFDGREVLVDFSSTEPAVVSSAVPPMLAAPSPALVSDEVPRHSAPASAPFKSARDRRTERQEAAARNSSNAHAQVLNEAGQIAEWLENLSKRLSPEAAVLLGVVGILCLVLLLRGCS